MFRSRQLGHPINRYFFFWILNWVGSRADNFLFLLEYMRLVTDKETKY